MAGVNNNSHNHNNHNSNNSNRNKTTMRRNSSCNDNGSHGLPIANHLLQHTLRSLCADSEWVYSVFWRILPRNYPPPKWDMERRMVFDRTKGSKRNWIMVWEDAYCDFDALCGSTKFSTPPTKMAGNKRTNSKEGHPSVAMPENEGGRPCLGSAACLPPQVFFKMAHDVYNYGEGLMGKVAADNSHKWIYPEPSESGDQNNVALLSSWQGSLDPHPRTWEAQFKAGIQTIALITVGEGLVQLGSTQKVMEDLNLVILLQRKFNYLQSIPGVFTPYPMPDLAMVKANPVRDHLQQSNRQQGNTHTQHQLLLQGEPLKDRIILPTNYYNSPEREVHGAGISAKRINRGEPALLSSNEQSFLMLNAMITNSMPMMMSRGPFLPTEPIHPIPNASISMPTLDVLNVSNILCSASIASMNPGSNPS